MLFFVGGFFMNTAKGEAATITVKSLGVSYSLSSPVSNINKDGSVSTIVLVGCAPQSGDLYDVNTGSPCNNNIQTALVPCKAGSGDVFDMNNGIRCSSYIQPVLFGCALKSGDNYDINTGNRCSTTLVTLVTPPNPTSISKINPIDPISKTAILYNPVEKSPISNNTIDTISTEGNQSSLSGREQLKDTLTASANKVGSIFKGPMSIWIILLIILILLGGGYGIYSLLRKPTTHTMPLNMPASHATAAEKSVEKKIEQAKVTQQSQPVKPVVPEVKEPTPAVVHTNPAPVTPATAPINTDKLPNLNTPQ
jgi:flagellar basal body-associated protein FliL